MPSSGYESSDLLTAFNQLAGRPATDSITDAQKYQRLATAQTRIVGRMMGVCPDSLYPKVAYGSLPTLTTTDNQTYTFGTDAQGYSLYPMGKGGIYANLTDIPDTPLRPGIDYMIEGTQIRCPNNNTLPATLYWYGVSMPQDISASVQPALYPEAARELISLEAARRFAQEYLRNAALADELANEIETRSWPLWCQVWKTQFRSGGAIAYTGRNLALLGTGNIGTGIW